MRFSAVAIITAALGANAAYPGDIVQYWVAQSALLFNGTLIGGLQSPPTAWYGAVVHAAIYQAAVQSKNESLAFQQLAVSHAAHNILQWAFHGTRNYGAVDASLKSVLAPIGLAANSTEGQAATASGRKAARKVAIARADDGINNFVDFAYGPKNPGVYQQTPGTPGQPDDPQAGYIRPFAGLGDITRFRAPPPPKLSDPVYQESVVYVKAQGVQNSTVRTAYDTDTAYFWRESSITLWSRLAKGVVKDAYVTDVLASAKFYAQFNFALANAGIAAWDTKFYYLGWRPVTAIQRDDIWLPSGLNVSDPSWVPLLRPTPSHPDYVSTHSTFGGAASAVIRAWNGGDKINSTVTSNVTLDSRGFITRTYTNLTAAALENSNSRIFGGIHFPFSGLPGIALGDAVARATLENFDKYWDQF